LIVIVYKKMYKNKLILEVNKEVEKEDFSFLNDNSPNNLIGELVDNRYTKLINSTTVTWVPFI